MVFFAWVFILFLLVMRRSEKSACSERSVYRARNDFSVTFILLLFGEDSYIAFPSQDKKGGQLAAF
jgi:hypothetical protein